MSAHHNGSGPRSNRYSEKRFTNWAEYEPWWLEVQAVYRRFDARIAKNPQFPKIIEFKPLDGFTRPCCAQDVEAQLMSCPEGFLEGLRAVFILSGTRKQLKNHYRSIAFYGHYWRRCIFLHAYPYGRAELNSLHRFYLRNVLMHELGHHLDEVNITTKDRERFAEEFAKING